MKAIEYRCAACGSRWHYYRQPAKCDVCGDDEMVRTGHTIVKRQRRLSKKPALSTLSN